MSIHSYSVDYFKHASYWEVVARSDGKTLVTLAHVEGKVRPYLITHAGVDSTYPTYSEACSVFMNLLRQGR